MASSQCQVQVSVNGGAWTSGGIASVPFGATVALRNISAGPTSYVWQLPDYPPNLALPSGWVSVGGVYTYYGATPTSLVMPTSGTNSWGKIPIHLSINGNPLQFNADGSLNAAYSAANYDDATILSLPSPNAGMPGFCYSEGGQFDNVRNWAGSVMANLRAIDNAGSQGPSHFSPLDFMISVNAAGIDSFTFGSSNLAAGNGFVVTDNVATHTITGVRTYWGGHATNLDVRIWRCDGGTTYTQVGAATTAVTLAQGVVTLPCGGPITLTPGKTYVTSVYDTNGTPQCGAIGGTGGPTWEFFNGMTSFPAASWWRYVIPTNNGGGGIQSPFSCYISGAAWPHPPTNISTTGFLVPCEPVLNY